MKIIFIHSGKSYFGHLGSHYGPLIKHSLHLIPINDYLQLPPKDKNKYRSIESLPTGCIIGIALIDKSFWLNRQQLTNPWSHGPYCYHIKETIRFPKPIVCSGSMGQWKISKKIQTEILSIDIVINGINEWRNKYNILNSNDIFSALTIMQPFAECIIRNIKDIENRGQRVLGNVNITSDSDSDDGQYDGCRICMENKLNENDRIKFDYIKLGGQYKKGKIHKELPKYLKDTNYTINKNASLIKCACKGLKRRKKRKVKKLVKKKKKCKMVPLHELNKGNNRKNRKPMKRRLNKYNYYEMNNNKLYNTRTRSNKNKLELYNQLINMGFEDKNAKIASEKYNSANDIENAIDYLHELETENMNGNNMNRKRKRDEIESDIEILNDGNNVNKRRKICNEFYSESESESESDNEKALYDVRKEHNEEDALRKALNESEITYFEEKKCREAVRKSIKKKCKMKKRKNLSSDMVDRIPRRKC